MIRSRLTKLEAPEVVRPRGRFRTLANAVEAFMAVRDRGVLLVEARGDALYSVCTKHPYFGELNGGELIQLIDGHARRHADQIREIGEGYQAVRKIRSKPVRDRKKVALRRDEPDLPGELEHLKEPDLVFEANPSVAIQDVRLEDSNDRISEPRAFELRLVRWSAFTWVAPNLDP